ncbi:MAG: hypothetical protein VB013_02570 [Anaerolineaceae bacterium]|nr:hypothetical protein [Anaerolineaceae bacterium]
MPKFRPIFLLALAVGILFTLSACTSSADDPAGAAAAYWQALADKDSAQISSLTCADFEAEAQNTFDSFSSVAVELNDLSCKVNSQEGDTATVYCSGTFVASYGTENLTIDLADHSYSVVKEGGDWRMCGAK